METTTVPQTPDLRLHRKVFFTLHPAWDSNPGPQSWRYPENRYAGHLTTAVVRTGRPGVPARPSWLRMSVVSPMPPLRKGALHLCARESAVETAKECERIPVVSTEGAGMEHRKASVGGNRTKTEPDEEDNPT